MDINTATSSTMTSTTDSNVSTQPQRVKKGDTSFQEEMNKFSTEQNETAEVSTEAEKTQITENTNTVDKKHSSQINKLEQIPQINSKPTKVDINIISSNKNIPNNLEQISQNNKTQENPILTNTAQLAQQNVAQIVVNDKHNKLNKDEKVITNLKQDSNNNEKQSIQNPNTQININKVQNKTEILTKETKTTESTKKIAEITDNNILKENITEQTQQIINEISTNTTQNIPVVQPTVTTQQPTPVIDTMQTLIEANKQLANITLLTDAKVVETKVTTKVSKEFINVDYTTIKMSTDDAVFFADLVQDTEKTLQNVIADLQSEVEQKVQETSKNVKVSATLMNAISEAAKTNQPLRIDFDKDISVVIKIDKDGAVNAKFIPGDKAVEEYLKQNISALRQRFDEQELNYRDLSYSNRQKQNHEQNRKNNKERDHE